MKQNEDKVIAAFFVKISIPITFLKKDRDPDTDHKMWSRSDPTSISFLCEVVCLPEEIVYSKRVCIFTLEVIYLSNTHSYFKDYEETTILFAAEMSYSSEIVDCCCAGVIISVVIHYL